MIRILIADDHAIVRSGLKQIIADASDLEVVAEAADCSELLDLLCHLEVDIVVLDIFMPGRSGLEALKQIHEQYPRLPVLMMSMYSEEQYAVRSIKTGAKGYMTKNKAPDELIQAIRTIASGRKYITPSLAEKLADVLDFRGEQSPHQTLSDREYEVMMLLAQGSSVKEIATSLNLSPNTINTYRERILQKLSLTKTADIVRYAMQNKLVE